MDTDQPESIQAPPNGGAEDAGATADENMTSKDYYFDSYSHFGIHEEMLKDEVRTSEYRRAIHHNEQNIRDKVVLDIGCGTGILSLFCAQVGAKHVYAIDCSEIAHYAKKIVAENGYESVITVIKGKVEDIELPVDKVDVIVSEWMGYFLFYESMLDTVIHARRKWLKPDGVMLPDFLTLNLVGIEDAEYKKEKLNFWDNVYGFSMKCIKDVAITEPLVDVVEDQQICTTTKVLREVRTAQYEKEDLVFVSDFELEATRNDYIHALVAYFDTYFTTGHKENMFSTSPKAQQTHWKQTVFYLPEELTICQGEILRGTLSCKPNAGNPRDLDITITYKHDGKWQQAEGKLDYKMR